MSPRYRKLTKKIKLYNASMDVFIERLRKARGLNSDPTFFGIDSDVVKKFSFHRMDISAKFL
jgi:hypothetical protein